VRLRLWFVIPAPIIGIPASTSPLLARSTAFATTRQRPTRSLPPARRRQQRSARRASAETLHHGVGDQLRQQSQVVAVEDHEATSRAGIGQYQTKLGGNGQFRVSQVRITS
jgi:hypothetical protein